MIQSKDPSITGNHDLFSQFYHLIERAINQSINQAIRQASNQSIVHWINQRDQANLTEDFKVGKILEEAVRNGLFGIGEWRNANGIVTHVQNLEKRTEKLVSDTERKWDRT